MGIKWRLEAVKVREDKVNDDYSTSVMLYIGVNT